MDQPILNTRKHSWLDVVNDYDCKILYQIGNDNAVTNALSRKAAGIPISDVCLRTIMITPLLDHICGA